LRNGKYYVLLRYLLLLLFNNNYDDYPLGFVFFYRYNNDVLLLLRFNISVDLIFLNLYN